MDTIRNEIKEQNKAISELKSFFTNEYAPSDRISQPNNMNLNTDGEPKHVQRESFSIASPLVDAIINTANESHSTDVNEPNASGNPVVMNSTHLSVHSSDDRLESGPPTTQSSFDFIPNSLLESELRQVNEPKIFGKPLKFEFFVSKFHNTVTSDEVAKYITERGNINANDFRVFRLTKLGQDLSRLAYVSFKIETNREVAAIIQRTNFWPNTCKIANFVRKDICQLKDGSTRSIASSGNNASIFSEVNNQHFHIIKYYFKYHLHVQFALFLFMFCIQHTSYHSYASYYNSNCNSVLF